MLRVVTLLASVVLLLAIALPAQAQIDPAPDRAEGEGPYERLVIRGATVIDGTGAPPNGPVDIVIEDNRIVEVRTVGYPGVPIDDDGRPAAADREIDAEGLYVMPGFVDAHAHLGGTAQGTPAEYVLKLWMGHGVTTARDPGSSNGLDWMLEHRTRSTANEITAPRLHAYVSFGQGHDGPIASPEQARAWVQDIAAQGADGLKFFGAAPQIMEAALGEAEQQGLGTAMHHAQMDVARVNVLHTATWGLTTMEHWYGLPEALFDGRTVQDYRLDYNYQNEAHRFGEAGKLWRQAAGPGTARYEMVMDSLLTLDLTLVPTFNIYDANRDLMRAINADWHAEYTLPAMWDFFRPNRAAHGSYHFYWTQENELDWQDNYRRWMHFVNDYKNRGGRVATGSDSGFIYQTYGFGFVRELELLREAGFHPLEVIRAATLKGAEAIGVDDEVGSIEVGKLADLVIVPENPLENLKSLYGTGWPRLNDTTGAVERVGGVHYTIKDGIVYDARELLADVRQIVREAKDEAGLPEGPMPVATD